MCKTIHLTDKSLFIIIIIIIIYSGRGRRPERKSEPKHCGRDRAMVWTHRTRELSEVTRLRQVVVPLPSFHSFVRRSIELAASRSRMHTVQGHTKVSQA
jgi:hypothetical protein